MKSGVASWNRIYRRVVAMDRAEISDRVRQQATARLDLLRYKAGADFAPQLQPPSASNPPRFFFAPEDVPALCLKMQRQFPRETELVLARAERIRQHRFDLLGYEAVDYGSEIDWHSDRIHGKRAPRKPWFRMKYLDFVEVGDSKVTWELNRHQHLVTLAKAFRLSGDHKFADELFCQWDHWHHENPYPIGINWASSLEVAFRCLSWIWFYFLLADTPALPAGFRIKWLRSLAISGRHIEKYLSTYFSPNTHLLGEAVALFFIGTLCPEIPAARRWQRQGWQIVQNEAKRQIRSDGLHFEQSTYYHVYALDLFLHSAVLASSNQIPIPSEFDGTLERMLQLLATVARGGAVPRLGDDDGGRLFDPSRHHLEQLLDPLATGAVLFGRGDFKALAGGPREETMWLLGEAGLDEFDRIPAVSPTRDSIAFPASGLYVMSGDSERQLVIDAGPQGADTAGHGHADALSITASSAGQNLLIDSGTFQYVGEGSERDRFRGTRAHNTLMVAGRDQAQPRGPFGWEKLPNVQAEGWIAGKNFDLFVGSHDGYSALPNSAIHRRLVYSLHSGFWLVRDVVLGFGECQLDLFWHLAPELHSDDREVDYFLSDESGIQIVTQTGHAWTRTLEQQPDSPVYGKQESHSALHFATRAALPAEFVTVLQPKSNSEGLERKLTAIPSSKPSPVVGYRYQSGDTEHSMFFGKGEAWKLDDWSSDAEFLYSTVSAARRVLICCNATSVAWNEKKIMSASHRVLRCEIGGGEQPDIVSSDPEALSVNLEAWKSLCHVNSQIAVKIT